MMNNNLRSVAGILTVAAATGCASGGTLTTSEPPLDRAVVPSPAPTPDFDFPEVEHRTLSNGLDVWIVEKPGVPLVSVQLLIEAGAWADPAEQGGLASLTAAMLTEGTTSRSAVELADEIEFLAASLTAGAGQETAVVALGTLTRNLEQALDLFADVVMNPAFNEADWERVRDQRLVSIIQSMDQPTFIATQEFGRIVYGESHPLGRPVQGTSASVQAISTEDLRDFHNRFYTPGNANLIVVGDVAADRIVGLLERELGEWRGGAAPTLETPPAPRPQEATRIILVDKPGAAQSEIRIGHVGIERTHEDYFPLLVLNSILGGQFSSRINLNLREDKGYTYGARSAFQMGRLAGPFVASAGVQTAVTTESVVEFMKELEEIRTTRPPTQAELDFARSSLIRAQPLSVETNAQIAARIQDLVRYDLPEDYFDTYAEEIAAVTLEDLNRVAREHLDPGRFAIVVVGDLDVIESGLRTLPYPLETTVIESPLAGVR